ncbi:hypothetical protein Q7P37_010104 [Cladosporium fusiforme]
MANQAWQIPSAGKLVLNDTGSIPTPGSSEVVVQIAAVSLNYRDVLVMDHNPDYPLDHKENLIPGSDGAGIISAAGSATHWKKGDRVVILPSFWTTGNDSRDWPMHETRGAGTTDGTFQRYVVCDERCIFKAPANMTLQEASTIYTAGMTSYRALFHSDNEPKLGPDSAVLTQGTGGVSCYAIQIAAAAGATVIATSSSDEKLEIARKLGAKHLINYRKTPDWSAEARRLTKDVGVDIVIDVVGGAGLAQSIASLRRGGRVAVLGLLDKEDEPVALTKPILFGAATLHGVLGPGSKELADEFCAFIEKHDVHPPIAQTFPFEKADEAFDTLRSLQQVGKVVVEV